MRIRMILSCCAVAVALAWGHAAEAKLPPNIAVAVATAYPPAAPHYGIKSAHEEPDPAKMRGYVVVERSGIPVERARYLVSWEDYDYRGATIDLAKGDGISTRRGKAYASLQRGDVMAVTGTEEFGRTIYLKLLSADVYVPDSRTEDKRFSRVSVMLGFTFPKEVFKSDDAETVLAEMAAWVKPFPNVNDAKAYARVLRDAPFVVQKAPEGEKTGKKARAEKVGRAAADASPAASGAAAAPPAVAPASALTTPAPEAAPAPSAAMAAEEARMKGLEEKIEAAKKQMEEAEREMKALKEEQKKLK